MAPESLKPQDPSSCNPNGNGTTNRRMKNFHRRYLMLCRAKNFQPLTELVGNAGGGAGVRRTKVNHSWQTVDFYGDRFKETDWQLIADALGEDSSLDRLAIRLRKTLNDVIENGNQRMDEVADRPVILVKRLFTKLMDGLESFLASNQIIKTLVLEALPIQGFHMATFVKGLQQNGSLVELSLARSCIRDDGCEAICSVAMHLPNLESLNVSGCQLTARGCRALADLVKYQKIQRFAQSWQYSLRYCEVDTEKMQGLRILALSSNPCVGDEGLNELTEVLKDDEWIRQVQFRNCGLTDTGAKLLVDCLNVNKTIKKFDIRSNSGMSNAALHEILVKLGEEVESSDSSQSAPETFTNGQIKVKAAEQVKCLQQQLAIERHRGIQMQLLVEQLRQQLIMQKEEYSAQLKTLKQECNAIINQRDELLHKVQQLGKVRPKSKKANLRKSKSVALPSDLFKRSSDGHAKPSTKSEMTLRWLHGDRASSLTNGGASTAMRPQIVERGIGDSGHNSEANGIQMAEMLAWTGHSEDVIGDIGVGCSKVTVRKALHGKRTNLDDITELSEDDYFAHVSDAADQQSDNGLTSRNAAALDEDENDEDDIGSSLSGAELLKLIAKQKSTERVHDTQSLYMSVFSGDEN
nr:protein Cep78 homolog [Aedes albopictus]